MAYNLKSMQQSQENVRATVIQNNAEEQEALESVLKQIPPIDQITFDVLLEVYAKCKFVKEEPEFVEALFNKTELYHEFVGWVVAPLKMAQKRMADGTKLPSYDWQHRYPATCVEITQTNNSFLIQLYLKSYYDQSTLRIWFQFLESPHLQTFDTSLSYVVDIMLRFINYDFSDCTKIYEELFEACDQSSLSASSNLQRDETQVSKEREFVESKKKQTEIQRQISVLTLFSDDLLSFLMEHIAHERVFKFLHNLILASLEEADLKRSKKVLQNFLRKALQIQRNSTTPPLENITDFQKRGDMDVCIEYVLQILKQIYDNTITDKNYRVIFFVDSVVRLNVISVIIERIYQSPLMVKDNPEEKLSASADFSAIMAEEEVLENYIKSLTYLIKIFSKMNRGKRTEEEKVRDSRFYTEEETTDRNQTEEEVSGESKVMKQFANQLNQVFLKLPELCQIVKKPQLRVIPFSSGQNVKPITMCKYEFFELLYNCLLLSKQFPELYVLDTEKINIFSIIQRYLQQNRWNNLAHKVLQKIACLLIMNNKNFFRTKEMNKNNMADEFLNTIIESFTNKKYIFLNSFRFTSQGNLHTLYTIAKAIISKMKESHNLANFVHELDYYKKFVMQDLQSYEKRIKQIEFPADDQDLKVSDKKSSDDNDQIKLYVDELSVSEIVKKIEVVNKWPLKESKRKHGSFIHRSLSYMSDENHHAGSHITERKRPKILPPSQQLLNTDDDSENEDANRTRFVHTASPRAYIRSEVKDVSRSLEGCMSFTKQQFKRTQSIVEQFRKSGEVQSRHGLFSLSGMQQIKQQPQNQQLSPMPSYYRKESRSPKEQPREHRSAEKERVWQNLDESEESGEEFVVGSGEQIEIRVTSQSKLAKNVSIEEKNNILPEDQQQRQQKQ